MTRRGLIFAVLASAPFTPLRADDAAEVWDLLSKAAAALSEGNALDFMQAFDRSMPDYGMLETNISALVRQYQARSSIEPLMEEGDSHARKIELDWFLELVEREDETNITRRRERIECRLVKSGKQWKIVGLKPSAFFAPPERPG